MKIIKRILLGIVILFGLLVLFIYTFNYTYLFTAVNKIYFEGHVTAYLKDYTVFENVVIPANEDIPWPLHKNYNRTGPTGRLLDTHRGLGTVAFLIIKNDSIWHEEYYDDYGPESKSNSFSMAKSFVSGLLGMAIQQGYIKSLEQPVSDFYPHYFENIPSQVTVGDLSSMASGMDWDESYYSPFSITTRAYFTDNLESMMKDVKFTGKPGEEFEYLSGNTQLLAMIIEKATGKKTAEYFSESFWKPMGANEDALWQVDSEENKMVKAYCCVASNARDFARFGKLYKDSGKFNGRQLLDSTFVALSIKPRFEGDPYGYGFWVGNYKEKDFFAMRGHLGQYVITVPQDNLIVVRLGHKKGKKQEKHEYPEDFWTYLDETYVMLTKKE